jgi:hypothetical protein
VVADLAVAAPVRVHLRGRSLSATAQAFSGWADPAVVEDGLVAYLHRFRAMGRRLSILGRDGSVHPGRLRELVQRTVMVRIVPTDAVPRPVWEQAVTEASPSAGLVGAIRRHPLGSFYALTFLLSWAYWVPDAIFGGHLSHVPGLVAPMISAMVITPTSSTVSRREGQARAGWRPRSRLARRRR